MLIFRQDFIYESRKLNLFKDLVDSIKRKANELNGFSGNISVLINQNLQDTNKTDNCKET